MNEIIFFESCESTFWFNANNTKNRSKFKLKFPNNNPIPIIYPQKSDILYFFLITTFNWLFTEILIYFLQCNEWSFIVF